MSAAGGAAGAAAPMSGRSDSGSLDGKGRWRRCGAGQLATAAARSDGGFFFLFTEYILAGRWLYRLQISQAELMPACKNRIFL